MSSGWYTRCLTDLAKGVHDLTSNTIKVLAVDAAYTFDPDHDFVNDVTANELSGTGYARQTLGSKTVTQDTTNNRMVFDGADIAFTGINAGTIGMLLIFRDRGGADSANELLLAVDNADLVTNGGNVAVVWNASGIGYIAS